MARATIDYGIDLGTTNSSVAFLQGAVPEVVPNPEGSLLTPSAVWFDRRGKLYAGSVAKNHYLDDEENAAVEFKLRMGQHWTKTFRRSGKSMTPEEMSAEVLKSLRDDVRTNRGEELQAAVITVPAAFELPQCDATRRAAKLAGFTRSPLLQEPVAAALPYGFQSASDKVFWLVYDFGGGTFDAAVIQVRDGVIRVVNHAGDNFLGGKNIDWDIVEKLLVPALTKERRLARFSRTEPRWRAAFAKLKSEVEKQKIAVSRTRAAQELYFDDLGVDDRGERVEFVFSLTPGALDQILDPWIEQSLTLCQRALREKGLSGADLDKVILVGGSSLFPRVRERLAEELGAPIDSTIDPMTVVARGAAIFAGTQRVEHAPPVASPGIYAIELEYDPVGNDIEPLVGGKVLAPAGATRDGLRIEIVNLRTQWRSGGMAIGPTGSFCTEVHSEAGQRNEFELILTDGRGSRLRCTPERFSYIVGKAIASPPLTHNVGLAMADNRPLWFFRKGEALPVRKTTPVWPVGFLRKAERESEDNIIRIPVIEGTHEAKADRNHLIGNLEIRPHDKKLRRDVPRGSEIEVTIEIDESRVTTVSAFVPIVDEEFREVFTSGVTLREPRELDADLQVELQRLDGLRQSIDSAAGGEVHGALRRIQDEQIVETVRRQVAAAHGDPDARGEADRRILDLRAAVDAVEDGLAWPTRVREVRAQLAATHEVVEVHGDEKEKGRLARLDSEIEKAISAERGEALDALAEEMRQLSAAVAFRLPATWVGFLEYLEEQREHMQDQATADALFLQAQKALASNDLESLQAATRQLFNLLPQDEQDAAEARGRFRGTIMPY